MQAVPSISASEWEVMQVIWNRSPIGAQDVVAVLSARKSWHARTVKTLLSRLVKKGALSYCMERNRYLYTPTISRAECISHASQSFLQQIFGGDTRLALMHFVENVELSPKEIEQLKQLLDGKHP